MPRVDFYIFKNNEKPGLCRIVEKAYQQGHKLYLLFESEEKLDEINKLLWTYTDISFLPHERWQGQKDEQMPIYLGHLSSSSPPFYDILINLTEKIPDFFGEFNRIIEVVSDNLETKQKSREKYKTYRDKQCELYTHSL